MKLIYVFFAFLFLSTLTQAQPQPVLLSSHTVQVQLFSSAPLEDIHAQAGDGVSLINEKTGEIAFQLKIRSFIFPHALMQEHFNENYLESDKFPFARFKGIIQEPIDYTKDGTYAVKVYGQLSLHGVSKDRLLSGTLSISKGQVSVNAVFNVLCAEHQIPIPTLVIAKIAESVRVTVDGVYQPLEKIVRPK